MLGWILFVILAYINIAMFSTAITSDYHDSDHKVVARGIFWPVILGVYLYNACLFVLYKDEKYLS